MILTADAIIFEKPEEQLAALARPGGMVDEPPRTDHDGAGLFLHAGPLWYATDEEGVQMAVRLLPETETKIRKHVEQGVYASADDVVLEALRLLDKRDANERLKAAIALGMADIERGDVADLTDELLSELRREADLEDATGTPMRADVRP